MTNFAILAIFALWPLSFLINVWVITKAFGVLYEHISPDDELAIICISAIPIVGSWAAVDAWMQVRAHRAEAMRKTKEPTP